MAFVTAVKGSHVVKVSRRSYETSFKKMGYRILGDESGYENLKNKEVDVEKEEQEQEQEEEMIETIPISEMNKEQLAEYAKEHNIDTSGARNVREARQIIQKAIREEKM